MKQYSAGLRLEANKLHVAAIHTKIGTAHIQRSFDAFSDFHYLKSALKAHPSLGNIDPLLHQLYLDGGRCRLLRIANANLRGKVASNRLNDLPLLFVPLVYHNRQACIA